MSRINHITNSSGRHRWLSPRVRWHKRALSLAAILCSVELLSGGSLALACTSATTVVDEVGLREAVACYNSQTPPGDHNVTLRNTINLSSFADSITVSGPFTANPAFLTIIGDGFSINGLAAPQGTDLFTIEKSSYVSFQSIGLLDSPGAAIRSTNDFEGAITIEFSGLLRNHSGVYIDDSDAGSFGLDLTIRDSDISESQRNGIYLGDGRIMSVQSSNIEFSGLGLQNSVDDYNRDGIHMRPFSGASLDTTSVANSQGNAVSLLFSANLSTDGANIRDNKKSGIFSDDALAELNHTWVHGNDRGIEISGERKADMGGQQLNPKLILNDSTVSSNGLTTFGFGIAVRGVDALIANSTISGNGFDGVFAGVDGDFPSAVTITNSTVFDNDGDGITLSGGTVAIRSTLIAGNTNGDCSDDAVITDLGSNVSDDVKCGFAAQAEALSLLSPLIDNGCSTGVDTTSACTPTHELQSGHPAIGVGDCTASPPAIDAIISDQREKPRIQCDAGSFESTASVPAAPTLINPIGDYTDNVELPVYAWEPSVGATWYQVWINGPGGNLYNKGFYADELDCASGICNIDPTVYTPIGLHTWWVRPWNPVGYGSWSLGTRFTINATELPGRAFLISPTATISTGTATYEWSKGGDNANWFQLWVNDVSGNVFNTWFRANDVGCANVADTCQVTPNLNVSGSSTWWVRTWNNIGYGPWSQAMNFDAP